MKPNWFIRLSRIIISLILGLVCISCRPEVYEGLQRLQAMESALGNHDLGTFLDNAVLVRMEEVISEEGVTYIMDYPVIPTGATALDQELCEQFFYYPEHHAAFSGFEKAAVTDRVSGPLYSRFTLQRRDTQAADHLLVYHQEDAQKPVLFALYTRYGEEEVFTDAAFSFEGIEPLLSRDRQTPEVQMRLHRSATDAEMIEIPFTSFRSEISHLSFAFGSHDDQGELFKSSLPVLVTGIEAHEHDVFMTIGDSTQIAYTLQPAEATNKQVQISVDKPGIISVDDTTLKAVGTGKTRLEIRTEDGGLTDTIDIYVDLPPVGEAVFISDAAKLVGNTEVNLLSKVYPANADLSTITWRITHPEVASVNTDGTIVPLLPGTTEITAESYDGRLLAACEVTIVAEVILSDSFNSAGAQRWTFHPAAPEFTLPETVDRTVPGYRTVGWTEGASGSMYQQDETYVFPAGELEVLFEPVWTAKEYTISLCRDSEVETKVQEFGDSIILPDCYSKNETSLRFLGWNTQEDGTGHLYRAGESFAIDVPDDRALFARWGYEIGSAGPGMGIVYYDKGYYSDGWRYKEVAIPEWVGNRKRLPIIEAEGSEPRKALFQIDEDTKTISKQPKTAAELCEAFRTETANDWYLPEREDLEQIRGAVYKENSEKIPSGMYWTATSFDEKYNYNEGLFQSGGIEGLAEKTESYFILPVRRF